MLREEIIKLVENYINQSKQGLEIEHPKFDFKSKWYDLTTIKGISEFLKDSSAIANTFGPDGFIVIGFDDKHKTFTNSPLTTSGLTDNSAIPDLINKNIDRQFAIDYYETSIGDSIIGILHVPPSIDKPHVIRNHKVDNRRDVRVEENRIFIRKSSQTRTANKYDLELMYYDRKNIVPDYDLKVSVHSNVISHENSILQKEKTKVKINTVLNIENAGRRPVSICGIKCMFSEFLDPSSHELHEFSSGYSQNMLTTVVQPGTIERSVCSLYSKELYTYEKGEEIFNDLQRNMHKLKIKTMKVKLTDGAELSVSLHITN